MNEAIDEGDKAADKIQAQVDKEDGDFDPDNAAEDEVEAVPEGEADDAGGTLSQLCRYSMTSPCGLHTVLLAMLFLGHAIIINAACSDLRSFVGNAVCCRRPSLSLQIVVFLYQPDLPCW